jgi:hypothetical protein
VRGVRPQHALNSICSLFRTHAQMFTTSFKLVNPLSSLFYLLLLCSPFSSGPLARGTCCRIVTVSCLNHRRNSVALVSEHSFGDVGGKSSGTSRHITVVESQTQILCPRALAACSVTVFVFTTSRPLFTQVPIATSSLIGDVHDVLI